MTLAKLILFLAVLSITISTDPIDTTTPQPDDNYVVCAYNSPCHWPIYADR